MKTIQLECTRTAILFTKGNTYTAEVDDSDKDEGTVYYITDDNGDEQRFFDIGMIFKVTP